MTNDGSPLGGVLLLAIAFAAYFLPTFIAAKRGHPNGTGIFILDLFLGWTFIGWLVALIWSVSAIKPEAAANVVVVKPEDKVEKLEKLAALKDRGMLSDAEYETEKAKLLSQ